MQTRTSSLARRVDPRRRGSGLVLSLLAVIVIGIVAASFLQLAARITARSDAACDRSKAFYLAEAGLGEAFSGMMFGKSGQVGSQAEPAIFGDGLFWVEVTDLGGDLRRLDSTGMCGPATANLSLVAQRGSVSIASLGVFSSGDLDIPEGVFIDAYNSSQGTYSGPSGGDEDGNGNENGRGRSGLVPPGQSRKEGEKVRLGTNGDVTVRSTPEDPTEIHGDVVPGKDGATVLIGDPLVTGETTPASADVKFPDIEVPKIDREAGIEQDEELPLMIRSGEFAYEHLRVAAGSDLVLAGPLTLVLEELQVDADGSLEFDTTEGEIRIYVEKLLDLADGSLVSTTGEDPSLVSLFLPEEIKDTPARLGSTGEFHGVIYSPKTLLQVGAEFEVFGALIAEGIELAPGSKIHFDQYLTLIANERVMPSVVSWRLVDFEPPVPGAIGSDPFRTLGIDRSALPLPADAHGDQFLEIEYYDRSGDLQSYAGLESDFNWNDVGTVVGGYRDGAYAALTGSTGTMLVK